MDYINIKGLSIFANHGVFEEEKKLGQKFIIDIDLGLSTQEAALTNNLKKTVHYGQLTEEIQALFTARSHDLIETCAEEIALYILNHYQIETVRVKVSKPWAPVMMETQDISVEVCRMNHRVFLSLGTNVGNLVNNLETAIELLSHDNLKIINASKKYKTSPWGNKNQDDFLNQVIEIKTSYEPLMLLRHLQIIEHRMGRKREVHWGPRIIDLDILFYDDQIIYMRDLIIPHPYIEERAFVLEPLQEIAPYYIHPVLKMQVRQLYQNLEN